MFKTIEWTGDGVRLIDQKALPREERYVTCRTYQEVAEAIRDMTVRGAPAIGVTAAMGIALGVVQSKAADAAGLAQDLKEICAVIGATRPTAVNLFWAIDRMMRRFAELRAGGPQAIRDGLVREAQQVLLEDIACCEAIGRNGLALVPASGSIMTHCNAGALATGGYGTALGVVQIGKASCRERV